MPAVYLHIGREKTGSSTIQSLASDHADFMSSAGVFCPLTVHGLANHARLSRALIEPASDRATIKKFRKDLTGQKDRKLFISAESLGNLPESGLLRLKRLLGGRELRILFYVRDYPSWLTSVYAQQMKRATRSSDFDDFFRNSRSRISILPGLERWAAVFGWHQMRIRTLDPSTLVGGNLISDVLAAIGVTAAPPAVATTNASPHWITLEVQRALAAAAKSFDIGIDSRSSNLVRRLVENCVSKIGAKSAQYLTRQEWNELADRFRADMAALGRHLNMSFPVSLHEPPEREFLPSFCAIPPEVVELIKSRIDELESRQGFNPTVRSLLKDLFSGESVMALGHNDHS